MLTIRLGMDQSRGVTHWSQIGSVGEMYVHGKIHAYILLVVVCPLALLTPKLLFLAILNIPD